MRLGHGKVAHQVGGAGAFAEVRIELNEAEQFSISFEQDAASDTNADGSPIFATGVEFGIRYAIERLWLHRQEPKTYAVNVTELRTMVVDSTLGWVAYAAAQAYFNALGIDEDPIDLDPLSRTLTLSYAINSTLGT